MSPGSPSGSPKAVKAKAEERGAEAGQTLNTWLVSIVRAATREGAITVTSTSPACPSSVAATRSKAAAAGAEGKRMSGWL